MKTILTTLVFTFLFNLITNGQIIYNYPSVNYQKEKDIVIKKVTISNDSTNIDFIYTNTKSEGNYIIMLYGAGHQNAMYIKADDVVYKLRSTAGISNKEGKETAVYHNKPVEFSASFEKIPSTTTSFDLIEGIDGNWNFYGVKLNNLQQKNIVNAKTLQPQKPDIKQENNDILDVLKTDSLVSEFKQNIYNFDLEQEIKEYNLDTLLSDKKIVASFLDSLSQFQDKTDKNLYDTLNYLKQVLNIKQKILTDIQINVKKQIDSKNTNYSVLNTIQLILIKLQNEISIIKEELLIVEKLIQEKEFQLAESKTFLLYSILVIVLLLILSTILFLLFSNNRKHNRILREKNTIIQSQNEEITIQNENILEINKTLEEQKNEIVASIQYAHKIQKAILPTSEQISSNFKNSFILYLPRNIVSGDFYWTHRLNEFKKIIIGADCTGHGVPGAFMSALGISLLNEIVTNPDINSASELLNELRNKIKTSLKQSGKEFEQKDGIDISVCIINEQNHTINYSGANNPLYLVRNNELTEYKADKQPIGIHLIEKTFTDNFIDYKENDIIYIFSDGFADQFGAKGLSKYKTKRYKQFLTEISKTNINEQKYLLEEEFYNWKGSEEQTDDILIVGIEL